MILAIDIGGTKFTLAVFDGDRMVRRESRATNASGGHGRHIVPRLPPGRLASTKAYPAGNGPPECDIYFVTDQREAKAETRHVLVLRWLARPS